MEFHVPITINNLKCSLITTPYFIMRPLDKLAKLKLFIDPNIDLSFEDGWILTIRKWEIVQWFLHNHPELVWINDGGEKTCGLCIATEGSCFWCPIYYGTGVFNCGNTPYVDYRNYRGSNSLSAANAREEAMFLKDAYARWLKLQQLGGYMRLGTDEDTG